MGQQQLLFIILGAIVVGVAVAGAVVVFNSQSASANRDEVVADLANMGAVAQGYYRKPRVLGGGGGSFAGLTLRHLTSVPSAPENLNGTYTLDPDPVGGHPLFVTLNGVGTEIGNDGINKVKVVMLVYADSVTVDESQSN